MDSRLGVGRAHELRIHGVAGTSPEGMLDDLVLLSPAPDSCGRTPSGNPITVSGRAAADPAAPAGTTRAYSWGSITSGRVSTAFYLLLLPYLMVNLAGWAAVPGQPAGSADLGPGGADRAWGVRLVTMTVRLAGIMVTVIFCQWSLLIAADHVGYQWAIRSRGVGLWVLAVGILLAAAMIEFQRLVTRLNLRPGVRAAGGGSTHDPVGYAWMTHNQRLLWNSSGIILLSRDAHHAVGLGSIAWVAARMVGSWADVPADGIAHTLFTLTPWVSAVAIGIGLAATVHQSLSDGRAIGALWAGLTRASPWIGRAAVVGISCGTLAIQLAQAAGPGSNQGGGSYTTFSEADLTMSTVNAMADTAMPVFLPVIRDVGLALTMGVAVWVLVAGVLAYAVRDRSEPTSRWAPFNITGFLLLGGAIAGGMGAAGSTALSRVLSEPDAIVLPGPLPEALAISFAALAVVAGWVVLAGFAVQLFEVDRPGLGWLVRVTSAVQQMLRGGSWLMAMLTVIGVAGIALLVLMAQAPDNPLFVLEGLVLVPQLIVLITAGLVAAIVAVAVAARFGQALGLVVFGGMIVLTVVVLAQFSSDEIARQIRPAALSVGLLTPAGLIAAKGVSAVRDRAERRSVAILWDVGTFFPRWFHPLSPPSYGDHVVTDLTALIEQEVAARPLRQLTLAPHSQGTVIAASAVMGAAPPGSLRGPPPRQDAQPLPGLALLTYGSPLQQFYAEFFPRLFGPQTTMAIRQRLGGDRWINLLRTSDPIAAPIDPAVDRILLDDPCSRNHSAYPREEEYRQALADLADRLGPLPDD